MNLKILSHNYLKGASIGGFTLDLGYFVIRYYNEIKIPNHLINS